MLPKIKSENIIKLLEYSTLGDIVENADEISMQIFKKIQEENPEYSIKEIDVNLLNKAIFHQNMKGISDEFKLKFLRLASDRQQFKRSIISSVISESKKISLQEYEKIFIISFLNLASLFDELFILWYEKVVLSEIGVLFQKESSLKFREKNNLLRIPYIFSIINKDGEKYFEHTLIEDFSSLVKRIIQELTKLSEELLIKNGSVELINYINALVDFYENDDPNKYEYLSKAVDALWLEIDERIIPIHSMEVYEDPGKYIVTPEMSLHIIDSRYSELNSKIKESKEKLIEYLKTNYSNKKSFKESINIMKLTKPNVYATLMESGGRIIFRPFGQNIPNWSDVRNKNGIRIFIDMYTGKLTWPMQKGVLEKILSKESLKYFNNENELIISSALVNVSGHEVAHNAFITEDLQDKLTPPLYAKIEETKASYTVLSGLDNLYSPREIQLALLTELSRSLSNLSMYYSKARIAYIYTSILSIKNFFKSNIISWNNDLLEINMSNDNIKIWIKLAKDEFDEIVNIYEIKHSESLNDFVKKHFEVDEDIKKILNLISI